MPMFDYKCDPCGRTFAKFKETGEDYNNQDCLRCGGDTHKLISAPAVIGANSGNRNGWEE